MKWITRERPKIDRIACPWLIRRFIDPAPEFLFVPADSVLEIAATESAVPYDVPDVELSHVGEFCSFDAFLQKYSLDDDGLAVLAPIVRGADTGRPDLAPEAAGLLAVSLGLSQIFPDDHEMLRHGMVMYDALHAWATRARTETHGWPPQPASTKAADLAVEPSVAAGALQAMRRRNEVLLLDVRKRPAYEASGKRIAGALWKDPFAVDEWSRALPRERPVVVYCVHGHEVSRGVRNALIARGCDAKILDGGFEAWLSAGGDTEPTADR